MNEIEFNISASKRPSRFQYKIISENCFKFEPLAVQIKWNNFVVTSSGMSVLFQIKGNHHSHDGYI